MSIKPKNHFKTKIVRKVKDITIGSTLSLLLLSASLQSCSSEDEYREGVITEGVRTYIIEVDVRVFKIVNEEIVPPDQSCAIITYRNGSKDTIAIHEIKSIVAEHRYLLGLEEPDPYFNLPSLASALYFSNLGYMAGRPMPIYTKEETSQSSSGGSYHFRSYYQDNTAYQKSQSNHIKLKQSLSYAPRSSKSGFFSGVNVRVSS